MHLMYRIAEECVKTPSILFNLVHPAQASKNTVQNRKSLDNLGYLRYLGRFVSNEDEVSGCNVGCVSYLFPTQVGVEDPNVAELAACKFKHGDKHLPKMK